MEAIFNMQCTSFPIYKLLLPVASISIFFTCIGTRYRKLFISGFIIINFWRNREKLPIYGCLVICIVQTYIVIIFLSSVFMILAFHTFILLILFLSIKCSSIVLNQEMRFYEGILGTKEINK